MHKMLSGMYILSALLVGGVAQAQDADTTAGKTTTEAETVTRSLIGKEVISLMPSAGWITYRDQTGNDTSRLMGGAFLNLNMANAIAPGLSDLYAGITTGLLYSHLGAADSNFVGTNAESPVGSAGANLGIIPINGKLGYNFGDMFRISIHGGGNVIYRSVGSSMQLGASSGDPDAVWKVFGNAGGDVEIGLGKTASILLRPDVTFTPDNDPFTAMVGVAIALS